MSICPVCGCKTDDIDFVDCNIEGNNERVCSFCDNQLSAFTSGKEPTVSQLRWLDSCIAKEYDGKREDVTSALTAIKNRFCEPEPTVSAPLPAGDSVQNIARNAFMDFSAEEEPAQSFNMPVQPKASPASPKMPVNKAVHTGNKGFAPAAAERKFNEGALNNDGSSVPPGYVKQLEDRISKLEKDFDRHKKMQTLKGVLEVVLPIILILLIMIVFFASGLYDTLKSVMDMSGMFAKVSPIINIFTGR